MSSRLSLIRLTRSICCARLSCGAVCDCSRRRLERIKEDGIRFRVLTTTYIGGTEREALDRLVRDYGAEVRVQYDPARTRLHAKAWLFRRHTGFDTAYVGSSNLSTSALLDGVEWNVRLSNRTTPSLLQKFEATFDTYWSSAEFERYDPDLDRDRIDDALLEASGRRTADRITLSLVWPGGPSLPVPAGDAGRYRGRTGRPRSAPQSRGGRDRHGQDRRRGLGLSAPKHCSRCEVPVAAIRRSSEGDPRAIATDLPRGPGGPVLRRAYVGSARPERWQHVFASVQSLTAYGVDKIPADAYEIVVIDEFHHAEAKTYRRIIDHLKPRELLGLTATPERTDGTDVRAFFDGRTAVELRLWEALGADLLCPFHYFAVSDGTDLRAVKWSRGRYDDDRAVEHLHCE